MLARIVEWEMIFAGPFSQRSQRKGLEHVEYSLTPAYDASVRRGAAQSPEKVRLVSAQVTESGLSKDIPSTRTSLSMFHQILFFKALLPGFFCSYVLIMSDCARTVPQ
jgi:hypothetical protein